MKIHILILVLSITIVSCNSQSTNVNLNPKLELIDKYLMKFEGIEYEYSKADSVLSGYKSTMPSNLIDSIRIDLIVNVKKVPMGKVGEIKNSLRKNRLMKITYKPKE